MAKSAAKSLSPKEQRFVEEYLVDSNAEAAARRAGYAASTARGKSHTWVCKGRQNSKPHVAAEIERRRVTISEATGTEAERVRAELARIAFHQMSRVLRVDEYGHPVIDYTACTSEDLDNLAEIHNDTTRERSDEIGPDGKPIFHTVKKTKIKQQDKLGALKELARINGIYEENKQAAGSLADTIADIQSRMTGIPIRRD